MVCFGFGLGIGRMGIGGNVRKAEDMLSHISSSEALEPALAAVKLAGAA